MYNHTRPLSGKMLLRMKVVSTRLVIRGTLFHFTSFEFLTWTLCFVAMFFIYTTSCCLILCFLFSKHLLFDDCYLCHFSLASLFIIYLFIYFYLIEFFSCVPFYFYFIDMLISRYHDLFGWYLNSRNLCMCLYFYLLHQ